MIVGLFGGSFNPPHLGHLLVAETVRDQFALDAVWWIPARVPPHKVGEGEDLAAPAHRLAMTRLAVADHDAFAVSDVEVRREGPSYTVETVRALQAAHPEHTFHLILGGDSLRGFASWRRPEEIAERVPLLVYRRPGAAPAVPEELEGRVRFAEAPLLAISSTDLRARCRAGRSLRYLVPEPVRAYIEEHRLYRA
ncbi:MAG: nicotinate-nucleotide adenylyltransferase [Rhodothermales bacterium]|nr:nicotinate-nucleotide adenylyltransferase [Rhodothermales bacterium]